MRLGPDIGLPLLTDPKHRKLAAELGDGILCGTQVSHFGAFGPESRRRWDWLLGRLHAVAHIGTLMHGTDTEVATAWVRSTQQAVLQAEGWDATEFVNALVKRFPLGVGLAGLGSMIDGLNDADKDRGVPASTTTGIGDRLVHVSLARTGTVAQGRDWPPGRVREDIRANRVAVRRTDPQLPLEHAYWRPHQERQHISIAARRVAAARLVPTGGCRRCDTDDRDPPQPTNPGGSCFSPASASPHS
ncbi:hypothetical protein [Kribbella sp. NBC_01510]|uniref:hypothetical protein n=1 Tax=Kribbella sp. NBC_01510 TaxID=2903581 RepID=UPI0038631D73